MLPFSFDPALELIVDPSLEDRERLFFNAGRLDRSVALRTGDYVPLAQPAFARIAAAER